jgi:hypothetical protein
LDAGLLALSALVPACLAASRAGNLADAGHDEGFARSLGLEAHAWRALDALPSLALVALPVGTRAARAAMGAALVIAAAGAALYLITRELLRRCADTRSLGPVVASVASMCAVLAPSWQGHAGAGGSMVGALLVIVALLCAERACSEPRRWRATAFAVALALGHDPLAGACAAVACACSIAPASEARRSFAAAWARDRSGLGASALAGLLPCVVAVARARASGAPASTIAAELASGWTVYPRTSSPTQALAFLRGELGPMLGTLAIAGAVVALLVERARPVAAGLLAAVVAGLLCAALGIATGPFRLDSPLLAAFAAACALAGVAMQAVVRAVAGTNVPFARASAAMVVVLEIALPVESADETLLRAASRVDVALWDELAWEALPPRSIVLLTSPRIRARAAAARARGSLRDDLVLVAADAPRAGLRRVLSRDAAFVPLWRDLELDGAPSGATLSSLATSRSVAMAYEPAWGKELGRHLVPLALFDVFEPEPRGSSDRRRLLEGFRARRERLARACQGDPELSEATAILLRARAIELAASGDRELVGRALEDLRAFAPGDPAAAEIVAHLVLDR